MIRCLVDLCPDLALIAAYPLHGPWLAVQIALVITTLLAHVLLAIVRLALVITALLAKGLLANASLIPCILSFMIDHATVSLHCTRLAVFSALVVTALVAEGLQTAGSLTPPTLVFMAAHAAALSLCGTSLAEMIHILVVDAFLAETLLDEVRVLASVVHVVASRRVGPTRKF